MRRERSFGRRLTSRPETADRERPLARIRTRRPQRTPRDGPTDHSPEYFVGAYFMLSMKDPLFVRWG
jgi:hypothetical protein